MTDSVTLDPILEELVERSRQHRRGGTSSAADEAAQRRDAPRDTHPSAAHFEAAPGGGACGSRNLYAPGPYCSSPGGESPAKGGDIQGPDAPGTLSGLPLPSAARGSSSGPGPASELDSVHHLLRQTDELRYRHPHLALRRALSLRDLVATFEDPAESRLGWYLVQSEAWAVLGSAQRSVDDLQRSESSLLVAQGFLESVPRELRKPSDAQLQLRLCFAGLARRASYLRCDQGFFCQALALNDDATRLFDLASKAQLVASSQIDRARILHRSGHGRRAVLLLVRCLETLDRELEPRCYLAALHNLAYYLLTSARTRQELREARGWLDLAIRQHRSASGELDLLHLEAMAALAALGSGRLREGLDAMAAAAAGFDRVGAKTAQAQALFHLARIVPEPRREGP